MPLDLKLPFQSGVLDCAVRMLEAVLLWIDAGLNFLLGLVLVSLPPALLRALGLPYPTTVLYPRIFGGVLIGIAVALALEALAPALGGLGLGGAIAINLSGAVVLVGCLVSRQSQVSWRGKLVLWYVVAVLVVLSAAELLVV